MQSKAEIDEILRQKSDAQEIPGVVAIAASGNDVLYQGAFGKRDLSKPDAMTADSVFWIASMTKAVTSAGAMQLVEQGKLSLDAPIGEVLPDLAAPQVLEGFDANGEPKLRPAKGAITLRHLMTHTAGFAYNVWNGDCAQYLEKTGTPNIFSCQNVALKTPIMSDPGTRWEYGINIDFVGKAVEAVSGKRLDAYLRDHMFTPLGMNDTAFKITDDMRQRLVATHARGEDGSLAPIPFEIEQNPEFHMGGGGLYSTAGDYIKFTRMILNKGRGNGNQVLKPETVALMGQNHIGDLTIGKMTTVAPMYTNDVDLFPDIVKKWGLSFLINTAKTPEGRSAGSLAWAGLANTYFWIDPARDVSGRHPDAGVAVRRRQVPGGVRGLRAWHLCRARCGERAEGGLAT
ncbi:methyl acetate hydrolase [Bradyrhizobium ottawaense]|uniref:Methyl acetate hydrolase n=1 Tax=Bradyrhizobium ottawaense TaxID=931866 RepID=A0ABV4FQN3_9BRAD